MKVDEQHPIWYVSTVWPIKGRKQSQGREDVRQLSDTNVRFETERRGDRLGLPGLSFRYFLGIVWIVNFEVVEVDWEIAQTRAVLGERATLTGAGNEVGSKS